MLEDRSAHFMALTMSCFLWSSIFTFLIPFFMICSFLLYYIECYLVTRIYQIRKKEDVFLNELLRPMFIIANVVYVLKVGLSVCVYAYLVGRAERGKSIDGVGTCLQKGLSNGALLYGPLILQLLLYVLIIISIKIGMFSRCPDLFGLNQYSRQQKRM